MDKKTVVQKILPNRYEPVLEEATAFAPSNIALCKYWGKRNSILNLPITSSLSVSLANFGAHTTLSSISPSPCGRGGQGVRAGRDIIILNGKEMPFETSFVQKIIEFLSLFKVKESTVRYKIETSLNIPMGAGVASSACGFAALVMALDKFYGWALEPYQLSILARLGSGSAARSIWQGFVEWQAGENEDGMDSHGKPLELSWADLRMGLLIIDAGEKSISSRDAMELTKLTSPYFSHWPKIQEQDMHLLKESIGTKDFTLFGQVVESNALAMHALMMSARPAIVYSTKDTLNAMHIIWNARKAGLNLFFTQDAGPNLKLLFLEKDTTEVLHLFPSLQVITPFILPKNDITLQKNILSRSLNSLRSNNSPSQNNFLESDLC